MTTIRNLVALAALAVALAAGTASASAEPAPEDLNALEIVTGLSGVSAGGTHSCAVTTSHQVLCWGDGSAGQLGIGEPSGPSVARVVLNRAGNSELTGVASVVTGYAHSCALLASSEVRCWGSNSFGQVGDGHTDNRYLPVPVKDEAGAGVLRDVVQLSAGGNTTCAVLRSQQVRCWGDDDNGVIGDGPADDTLHPLPTPVVAVAGAGRLQHVTQVDVGTITACARLSSGEARCWGQNVEGQLGNGTDVSRNRPTVVKNGTLTGPLTGVRRIAADAQHTCAVRTDGTARCWGAGFHGQLGNGRNADEPRPVGVVAETGSGLLRGIVTIDVGSLHTCALLASGQVRCWGENMGDQLGNGVEAGGSIQLPSVVRNRNDSGNLIGVAQLSVGNDHTCVRLANGEARCWGFGQTGALGDAGTANQPLPRTVVREPAA